MINELQNAMDELLDEMERVERKDSKFIRARNKVRHIGYEVRREYIEHEIIEDELLPISEKMYSIRIDDKDNGIYVPEEEAYSALQSCSASIDQITCNLMFWNKEPDSRKYTRTLMGKPALIVESELFEIDEDEDDGMELEEVLDLFNYDQADFEDM